jgi:hypothetical protein
LTATGVARLPRTRREGQPGAACGVTHHHQEVSTVTIPRPIALVLAGLALTASLTACSSGPRPFTEKDYARYQMEEIDRQNIQNQIEQRDADIRRAVRDELARQRRP